MPFEERSIMSQREEMCRLAVQEGANRRQLSERYGISPPVLYKWLHRFEVAGVAGLGDLSRRPHTSPERTEEAVEAAVLAVRDQHPAWGGRKIQRVLAREGLAAPAASTITAILKRHGRIDPAASEAATPFTRFEHDAPNRMWQMDYKGHFAIDSGRCHPLTVLDDHSRFALCLAACPNQTGATVTDRLTATFRRYGLPEAMVMDNGSPWGDGPGSPWTPLTVWLLQLGIRVAHGRPYHPQTQGKDERFHRTLKAELISTRRFRDLAECQQSFDAWRHVYNAKRPHQALAMAVPADRYRPSTRSFPERLGPPEYAPGDIVRKVQHGGFISFKGRAIRLCKAFHGHALALRPTNTDGVWDACFGAHRVAQVDLRHPVLSDQHV
jgi:transposase InsO family protein